MLADRIFSVFRYMSGAKAGYTVFLFAGSRGMFAALWNNAEENMSRAKGKCMCVAEFFFTAGGADHFGAVGSRHGTAEGLMTRYMWAGCYCMVLAMPKVASFTALGSQLSAMLTGAWQQVTLITWSL